MQRSKRPRSIYTAGPSSSVPVPTFNHINATPLSAIPTDTSTLNSIKDASPSSSVPLIPLVSDPLFNETISANRLNASNAGRRRIPNTYIDDRTRRHITFSKRKAGLIKKANELACLTGTEIMLLVASEAGTVYFHATDRFLPLVDSPIARQRISECLTAGRPRGPIQTNVKSPPLSSILVHDGHDKSSRSSALLNPTSPCSPTTSPDNKILSRTGTFINDPPPMSSLDHSVPPLHPQSTNLGPPLSNSGRPLVCKFVRMLPPDMSPPNSRSTPALFDTPEPINRSVNTCTPNLGRTNLSTSHTYPQAIRNPEPYISNDPLVPSVSNPSHGFIMDPSPHQISSQPRMAPVGPLAAHSSAVPTHYTHGPFTASNMNPHGQYMDGYSNMQMHPVHGINPMNNNNHASASWMVPRYDSGMFTDPCPPHTRYHIQPSPSPMLSTAPYEVGHSNIVHMGSMGHGTSSLHYQSVPSPLDVILALPSSTSTINEAVSGGGPITLPGSMIVQSDSNDICNTMSNRNKRRRHTRVSTEMTWMGAPPTGTFPPHNEIIVCQPFGYSTGGGNANQHYFNRMLDEGGTGVSVSMNLSPPGAVCATGAANRVMPTSTKTSPLMGSNSLPSTSKARGAY